MRIRFTKMQGAGNDFVVLDETRGPLGLTAAQYRFLGDRHFGVGADQILTVRPSTAPDIDFQYVIHNADGGEVEQCGNGARCFLRFVREQGLTDKDVVRVQTLAGVIAPRMNADGRVTVDMGPPVFEPARVPFDTAGLDPQPTGGWETWHLALSTEAEHPIVPLAVLSMGNPHAVQLVPDVDTAPVATQGPLIEHHPRFPQRVNAGFLQVLDRGQVRLRVYERGAGETLACGTGACAAVVAGIRLGLLDARVDVHTRGGVLTIEWAGEGAPVLATGPAVTVFAGEIEVPEGIWSRPTPHPLPMRRLPLRQTLLLAALGLSLALAGCFYLALRTRTADVSALPPFAAAIGSGLPLLREVRLVRSDPAFVRERPYRLVSDPAQPVFEGEPPAIVVPAGTVLRFDAARLFRNGTSGNTHPTLLGTLTLDGQAYPLEYSWGEPRHMNPDGSASFGPPLRFLFPQAPWQPAADPAIYTFPEP